jgi:predicted membrane protein
MAGLLKFAIRVLVLALLSTIVAAMIGAMRAKREAPPLPDAADDLIDLQAVFSSLEFHSTATAFRGGTLTTWFGGGNLDLRDATLDPMGARLEVRAIFGGGSILVPDEWDVSVRVMGIGGAGDARPTRERGPDAPRLEIEGIALFGGFGVMSQLPTQDNAGELAELAAAD